MKKNFVIISTVLALFVGGTIFAFNFVSDCPLAGTKECTAYQSCPKKGQADCPLLMNCPKKGTADCPYTKGKASCCAKK